MIPQKYIGVDPYGQLTAMSKIELTKKQFLPIAQAKETGSHVLTFWIMSNANKDIVIKMGDIDKTESVSTTWKCISIVEQLDADEHVDIKLPSGTYYIWHAKLERGTKPTDWTVAPEDTDKQIAEVTQRTAELTISLDGITESVSRLETEGEAMNTRLKAAEQKITPESIVSTVVDSDGFGNKVVSEINQTSDEVKISADKIRLEGYTIADNFEATNINIIGKSKFGGELTAEVGGAIGGFSISQSELVAATTDTFGSLSVVLSPEQISYSYMDTHSTATTKMSLSKNGLQSKYQLLDEVVISSLEASSDGFELSGNIVPDSTDSHRRLGNSSKEFASVHSRLFYESGTLLSSKYQRNQEAGTLSLGSIATAGYMTSGNTDICFTIPTGRNLVGRTISKLSFNVVARNNDTYCIGLGTNSITTQSRTYAQVNGTSANAYVGVTAEIQGNTNITVTISSYTTSTGTSRVSMGGTNNNAVGIYLSNISVTFS